MRVKIAQEGSQIVPGQCLLPGSVQFPDEVPITRNWNGGLESLIGKATNFMREDDGWITAEVGELDIPMGMGTTVYLGGVESDDIDGVRTVKKGDLKAVFLTDCGPWKREE